MKKFKKTNAKIIHPIVEHPWGQRAFRIYDPDNHIIEFGESMQDVILRLYSSGLSTEEITKKSLMPIEFVNMVLKNNLNPNHTS